MDKKSAIEYINEMLNNQYDLMQDRKLDSDYESDNDLRESTKSEIGLIINAQRFMESNIDWTLPYGIQSLWLQPYDWMFFIKKLLT